MNLTLSLARMRQFSPWVLVFASAAVAAAAYWQALDYPFIMDDKSYITENTKLSGLHFIELWRLFTEPYNEFSEFLPLRDLTYWLDIRLFGLDPSVFRIHNILLYLLCMPLVYGATLNLWRYFRPTDSTDAPWAAAAVAALFALHPAHVEAVVWISSLKYVLPNLFSMLAFWLAMSAKREHGLSLPLAAAALMAFVAVMLSKASYVTVAPVIALLWLMFWCDIPPPDRRRSQLLWPLAILILAALLVIVFISSSEKREHAYFGLEVVTRALAVLGWMVRLVISPESHHFFYPVFEDSFMFRVVLGLAALISAVVGGMMLLRKRSLENFAMVVFLLLSLPYLQLIPYAPPSLVSDRFVALAMWPVILLVVVLAWRLKPTLRVALLLAIALTWGIQTAGRTRDWQSWETLIDADLRAFPGYAIPAAYKAIDQYTHGSIREAVQTASSIRDPELREVMIGLIKADSAVTYAETTGKPRESMALLWKLWLDHKQLPVQAKWNSPIKTLWVTKGNMYNGEWMRLIATFPDDMSVRYNAGLWMLDAKRYPDAVTHLQVATESNRLPGTVRGIAFAGLGLALLNSGHRAEAEAPLRAALEQVPPDLQANCSLAEMYRQDGRFDDAARAAAHCPSGTPSIRPALE